MMSSSSNSDIQKEDGTPSVMVSSSPTSGVPKPRRAPTKRVRPRTAGPMGNGSTKCNSKGNTDGKFANDNITEKRTAVSKNSERKDKECSKRVRSTSAHGR